MNTIREFRGEYRFLSNFWPAKVVLDQQTYPTVEHAFQAAKFKPDSPNRTYIAALPVDQAGYAKRLGRRALLPRDWDEVKFRIMENLLIQKFSHTELKTLLLKTGTAKLVEGNNWNDRIWGVDLQTGEGENNLGKLLMKVRRKIRPLRQEA